MLRDENRVDEAVKMRSAAVKVFGRDAFLGSWEFLQGERASDADTMGMMDRDCAVCHQPIQDQEQWFRVYEEYVHPGGRGKQRQLQQKMIRAMAINLGMLFEWG